MVWIILCKTTTAFGIIYDMKIETQMGNQTTTLTSHSNQLNVFTTGTVIIEFMSCHIPSFEFKYFFYYKLSSFHSFTIFCRNDLAKVDVLHIGMIKSFGLRSAYVVLCLVVIPLGTEGTSH